MIALAAGLALAALARAAGPSAESFVAAIYDSYKGKDARGVALDTDAQVRRYFTPELAALILKDRRDARGEVGKLDGDPFVDAQDWQIERVDVAVRPTAADTATATVTFDNGGARTVVLDMVRLKAGWRIADIRWDRNETLRGLLAGK
jgi:hypothetical protein